MSKDNGKSKKPDGRKISRKLNLKQRHFIAEFTNPKSKGFGNQTKAAELAGYSPKRARITGSELVTNRNIRSEVERSMEEIGITRKMVAKALRGGLQAKVTRVFCPPGGVVYSRNLVDHPTRLKAAEIAFKLRGDFPATKTTLDVQGLGNIGIEIIAEARKRASERHDAS